MIETIIHEAFHAFLPTLVAHLDYLLTALVAAVLYWVREKLQVKVVEAVVAEVEEEGQREAAAGHRPTGALKKWRAKRRSDERMNVLVRPRESKLDKQIDRACKKQKTQRNKPESLKLK